MSSTTTTTSTTSTIVGQVPAPTEPTITFQTGVQYGFFFDQSRCWGCHACSVACKDWNMLPAGPLKPMRTFAVETGSWPNVGVEFYCISCYHCANPTCIPAANGALIKEPKYGAVLIDPKQATSENLKAAVAACPYGAISFDSDAIDSTAFKCNMCIDRLDAGKNPSCVMACPARAMDFDTMANLQKKYGNVQQIGELPAPTTQPSVVFKARIPKSQVVPYDANAAITLWSTRGSLPAVLPGGAADLNIPSGTVRFEKLHLAWNGVDDEQLYTADVD